MTVVTATRLEHRAVRRAAPHAHAVRSTVGLAAIRTPIRAPVVISVGLCGGLEAGIEPGSVLIPGEVGDGERSWGCDPAWSDRLCVAAARLHLHSVRGRLATSREMVTGPARAAWARLGFAAVDMETALLMNEGARVAAVRVVLDSPSHELSPRWRHPATAIVDPRRWGEALWLVRHAPAYARRAAEVLASALADREVDAEV